MMFISELIVHQPKTEKGHHQTTTRIYRAENESSVLSLGHSSGDGRLFRRNFHPHTPFGVAAGVDGHCCLSCEAISRK